MQESVIRGLSLQEEQKLLQTLHQLYTEGKISFDDEVKLRKDQLSGLSHSFIIIDKNLYLLPHRRVIDEQGECYPNPDLIGEGGESEVRRAYKVEWPSDQNNLPSFSREFYVVKESSWNPEYESYESFLANQKRKFNTIRTHEDTQAIMFYRKIGKNDKFYIISKGIPGLSLEKCQLDLKEEDSEEKFDLAIQILDKVAELHETGVVHGDLSQGNIIYDETTRTTTLIDFSFSTQIGSPVIEPERLYTPELIKANKNNKVFPLADFSQDMYQLGESEGSLSVCFNPTDYEKPTFAFAMSQLFLLHFLAANNPNRRPTAKDASKILKNLKKVFLSKTIQEWEKIFTFNKIVYSIQKKKDKLQSYLDSNPLKKPIRNIISLKMDALNNLQDMLSEQFLRCYAIDDTQQRQQALNHFVEALKKKDWHADPETEGLFKSRTYKGLVADVALFPLGGFLIMLIRGIAAAIEEKSFWDNFSIFGKPSSVDLVEKIIHEEIPTFFGNQNLLKGASPCH